MTAARKDTTRNSIDSDHRALLELLENITPDQWSTPVYTEEESDNWTVRTVFAHLANAAAGLLGTAQAVSAGYDPVPPDFNLTRRNQRVIGKSAIVPDSTIVERINTGYDQWIVFLCEIPEAHLDRTGHHASGQVLSVEELFMHYARHEAHHASDIRDALEK